MLSLCLERVQSVHVDLRKKSGGASPSPPFLFLSTPPSSRQILLDHQAKYQMDIVDEVCRKGCAQSGWPLTLSQLHELVTQKHSKMKLAELKAHVEALQTQGKL